MQLGYFYPDMAEEMIIRELAAIQRVKVWLLHYQLVGEIGEWLLDLIVHSLRERLGTAFVGLDQSMKLKDAYDSHSKLFFRYFVARAVPNQLRP